jgi:hypothetical protein
MFQVRGKVHLHPFRRVTKIPLFSRNNNLIEK